MATTATKKRAPAPTPVTPSPVVGKCAAVHQWCEQYARANGGRVPTAAECRAECQARIDAGDTTVNHSNWQQELSAWRRAHGIRGRVPLDGDGKATVTVALD